MRLHKASISAVLPEPTGPPTPTRSGPLDWLTGGFMESSGARSAAEQPGILGLVAHARDVGPKRRAADVLERTGERPLRAGGNDRFEAGEHALPVGLSQRNEPQSGRHEIARNRLQKRSERRLEGDVVTSAR